LNQTIGLIACMAILAAGQLLFKKTAQALHAASFIGSIEAMLRQPAFYAAVTLYALSTFLWVWVLTRVPLSIAYPFVGLAMMIVPLLGCWFFGETTNLAYWIGAAMVAGGIVVIQLSA
jgi:drug/metabolite transporter (DMT)-like permease